MTTRRMILTATLLLATTTASALFAEDAQGQWLQWGGPNRNFMVEASNLADEWPSDGPRKIWQRPLGSGYSGIVADDDVLYTMYRKKQSDAYEYTIALDAKTGETIWQKRDLAAVPKSAPDRGRTYTGPNATPLIVGERLFTVGRNALLNCRNKVDGKLLWKHELTREFGAELQGCGFSSSPLAYKETMILPLGRAEGEEREGDSLVAFDQTTGEVVWKRHTFRIWHSSPILITLDGQDQLVQGTRRALIGVDPANGNSLWEYRYPDQEQLTGGIETPVWNGQDSVMFSQGQLGCAVRLSKEADKTSVELLWSTNKAPLGMGTPILAGDLLVGSKAGANASLVGQDAGTGERLWLDRAFQQAVLVASEKKLIMLDQNGQLGLATATREGLTVHSQCQLTQQYSFTVPTLVGTTLYVRDEKHIMALDLGKPATGDPS